MLEIRELRRDEAIAGAIAGLKRRDNSMGDPRTLLAVEEFRRDFPDAIGEIDAQGYRGADGVPVIVFEDGEFRGVVMVTDSNFPVVVWKR